MNWHTLFTTKDSSGRVIRIYWSAPRQSETVRDHGEQGKHPFVGGGWSAWVWAAVWHRACWCGEAGQ